VNIRILNRSEYKYAKIHKSTNICTIIVFTYEKCVVPKVENHIVSTHSTMIARFT